MVLLVFLVVFSQLLLLFALLIIVFFFINRVIDDATDAAVVATTASSLPHLSRFFSYLFDYNNETPLMSCSNICAAVLCSQVHIHSVTGTCSCSI